MKKAAIVFLMIVSSLAIKAQNIHLTFTGIGESSTVEQVRAMNLSTEQEITFPGDGTLILKTGTDVQELQLPGMSLLLYPNPSGETATLVLENSRTESTQIILRNLVGQIIYQEYYMLEQGENSFKISYGSPGIYLIEVQTETDQGSIKTICTEGSNQVFQVRLISSSASDTGPPMKSQSTEYSLSYTLGDILAFKCCSGQYTTTITDSPVDSKTYEIEFIDCTDPDGQSYELVKIGRQFWMAENLAYLPFVDYTDETHDSDAYCYVFNYSGMNVSAAKETAEYQKYGALYNLEAARIFCPDGWRLPVKREWQELSDYLGKRTGHQLKKEIGWANETYGSNISQFNALPGGKLEVIYGGYMSPGYFKNEGIATYFWTLLESANNKALSASIDDRLYFETNWFSNGFSVRCIRDEMSVMTVDVLNILDTSALGNGFIYYSGDTSEIISRGFCWSEYPEPNVSDSKSVELPETGTFYSEISTLKSNTRYYVKAYLTTVFGETLYGSQRAFTSADGHYLDDRDSTIYGFIELGYQVWMNRNIEFGGIPDEENKNYGSLYRWNDYQNACPEGWILPGDDDWKELESYLGMDPEDIETEGWRNSGSVGEQLKSAWGWSNGGNGDNANRFDVRPAGYYSWWGGSRIFAGETALFSTVSGEFQRLFEADSSGIYRFYRWYDGSIRCLKEPPVTVFTSDIVADIGDTTVTVVGEVVRNSDSLRIIARGFCWNIEPNPTILDDTTMVQGDFGRFTSTLQNLDPATKYFLKAYATLSNGKTYYGNQITLETKYRYGSMTDPRDGNNYLFVNYGNYSWMIENLAYLPQVDTIGGSLEEPRYYVYDYRDSDIEKAKETENYNTYGVLYNWIAAQSACPDGWFLPSDTDWKVLELHLGLSKIESDREGIWRESGQLGLQMKSETGWDDNGNGTNSSRFNALPGAYCEGAAPDFRYQGSDASFWTSTMANQKDAWHRTFFSNYVGIGRIPYPATSGFSIRCSRYSGELPIVQTSSVTSITESTAMTIGLLDSPGNAVISELGFCWDTIENPTISNNKLEANLEDSEFAIQITGLAQETGYYVRAYATNQYGTSYGTQISFKTVSGLFTDQRDSQTYGYYDYGSQTWMAENLAYLPDVSSSNIGSSTESNYYVYGYEGTSLSEAKGTDNHEFYGVLYNWEAARNACPPSWHLPTDEEWKTLEKYLGMSALDADNIGWRNSGDVGKMLKSTSGWNFNGNGDNSSGFKASPGGFCGSIGGFDHLGNNVYFWSSSPDGESNAWLRDLNHGNDGVDRGSRSRSLGYSVRCLYNYPQVLTSNITQVSKSSAMGGGNVVYPEDETEIATRGICWSTYENPTISDYKTDDGSGNGEYSSQITGLTAHTIYYVRAYLTLISGENYYGKQVVFTTTDGSFQDERDGTIYSFIYIGEQSWMVENLAYLPDVSSSNIGSSTEINYYVYGYEGTSISEAKAAENHQTYGALYNWEAAKTACPAGWHLPTDGEWKTLEKYLGMSALDADDKGWRNSGDVGIKLKSTSGWNGNGNGDSSSGFKAFPGGFRGTNGDFDHLGNIAYFWSSSPDGESYVWRRYLNYGYDGVNRGSRPRSIGFSVRCTKD